jgi:hypothetical protein
MLHTGYLYNSVAIIVVGVLCALLFFGYADITLGLLAFFLLGLWCLFFYLIDFFSKR